MPDIVPPDGLEEHDSTLRGQPVGKSYAIAMRALCGLLPPERSGARSSVSGRAGKGAGIDVQLGQRPAPLGLVVLAEDQGFIRRTEQPGILGDLAVELARTPAGIAKGKQAGAGPAALGDRLEDIKARGE